APSLGPLPAPLPGPSSGSFVLDVNGWSLSSDGVADLIAANMQAGPGADPPFELRLRLVDDKPPALHHGGYIDYGIAGGSYYYSRTRLKVTGALRLAQADRGGQAQAERGEEPVSGVAWMDHQWGNFVVA